MSLYLKINNVFQQCPYLKSIKINYSRLQPAQTIQSCNHLSHKSISLISAEKH